MVKFELLAREASRRGLDKDDEVVRTKKQVMIQQMMKTEFEDKVKLADITDQEIEAYYKAHPEEFNKPAQMRASQIVLKDEAKAKKILKQLLESQGVTMLRGTARLIGPHEVEVTTAEGTYNVPYLAPGNYRLTVEAAGFKRYVREGIQLRTGETPRLDIALEVGAVTESVQVDGAAALLETETSASGLVLSGDQLLKIPVPQKRAIRALFYYPGASAINGFHFLGQRPGAMGYTMFNTVIPPNGGGQVKWGACRNNCCPQARHADYVNASSFHPGGVNVMFADGSVRFVKNTVAMNVWWALGTRANGEVISSDAF